MRPKTVFIPSIRLRACAALLPCMALACTGTALAQARSYALDPVHTRVMFAVDHAGFSSAIGTVSGSTGTLMFDPDDWASARLDVQVPLQRLDLGDERWNRNVLAAGLLNAQRHPHAVFASGQVEPLDHDRARVHGLLTLRGTTAPVVLDVTLNALKRSPMPPFRRMAGFSATARLSRSDFGITAWPNVIGDEVELRIEVEAVHAPRGGRDDDEERDARGEPVETPDSPEPEAATQDDAGTAPVEPDPEPAA